MKKRSDHQYFWQSCECWSQFSFHSGDEDREGAICQKKKRTAANVGSSLANLLTAYSAQKPSSPLTVLALNLALEISRLTMKATSRPERKKKVSTAKKAPA